MRLVPLVLSVGSIWLAVTASYCVEPDASRSDLLRVVSEAPSLSASFRRALAARERIESAGRLADPEVEGMASRMDGPMGDRSTTFEINLRQPLPRRGQRAADRERAEAGVSMADANYAVMAGELAAETAMAIAEAEAAQSRIRLLETQLARLSAVLRSIEVRLSAGSNGRIADRLTVQTRVASLQFMIEDEKKNMEDSLAEARGRLGLLPEASLPAYAVPTIDEIALDDAAELRLAVARAADAAATGKLAKTSANPMTAIGLRLERERTTMGDEDTVGVAFMSEIPCRSRRYARAEVRAAEAERVAAQAEGKAVRYRIASSINRVERAQRLATSARRLSSETLSRLNAEYDSMVRAAGVAGSGESAVLQTVELLEKVTETELQIVNADLAERTARAELWRYMPALRFETTGN